MQELYLLCHQQGAELRGEAFDEILVENTAAQCARRLASSSNFPEIYKLIDRARVALEVPEELLSCPPF